MTRSVVYGSSVLLDAGGNKWTNLADPASGQDATTKAYVDALVNGAEWKQQCRLATAAALPTNVYANGSSGVGATLTGTAFGALTIDGVTPAVGNRVLVKNEAAPANNGIYTVTVIGAIATLYVLTRAADYDQAAEVAAGTATFVTEGTANADTAWIQTTTGMITVGSTSLVFAQFGGAAVSYATPAIVLGSAAAAGAASTVIRSDSTIVAFDATVPSTQAFGDAASAGSAAVTARRDHKHAMPANPVSLATPAIVLGSSAAAGAASTLIRSDSTIAAFDATSPVTQAFGDAAAVGSAAFAARRDHTHGMPADPTGTPWTKVQKVGDTSISSSGVPAADPDLTFTAASGGAYEIVLVILYGSPAGAGTPDLKMGLGESATVQGYFRSVGLSTADAIQTSSFAANNGSFITLGTAAANRIFQIEGVWVGAGGAFQFLWSQNTSGTNATIVRAGSALYYRRLV